MKLVRPLEITDALLTSSDVALEAQWLVGTTYALAATVRGTGDQAHKLYESIQGSNTGHAVTDEDWWLDIGPANRWAMFDGSPQSQTTNANAITVVIDAVGRVDSIGLENVNADTIQIVMTDAVDGVIYDETFSMVSDSGITDWWAYFFEPIERVPALSVTELPTYADPQIEVTISDPGQTPAVGEMVLGLSKYLGGTQWGASVGIQDYSRKEVNDFGVATIVQRPYAKRASFDVWVAAARVDTVLDLLASYRATPLLFVGDEDYTSTAIYGFIREFGIAIEYPDVSVLTLEVEGLA